MTFTTADCKKILIETYPNTQIRDWKRVSKYKDNQIVCRNFEHPTQGTVIISEIKGELVISGVQEKVTNPDKIFYRKTFNEQEIKDAKALLTNYFVTTNCGIDPTCLDTGFKASPSLMGFYFEDTEGYFDTKESELIHDDIIKYKDLKRPNGNYQLMMINLYPKDEPSDMGEVFVRDFLPTYFDAVAESLFEVDAENEHNLTMFDIFQTLFGIGMSYLPKECMFKNVMKTYTIVDRPETEIEKEQYEIKVIATKALLNDDVALLKTVYGEKFDRNMLFDLRNMYDYCKYGEKPNCLKFLLENK